MQIRDFQLLNFNNLQKSTTPNIGLSGDTNSVDTQLVVDEFQRSQSLAFGLVSIPAARKENLVQIFQGRSEQQRDALLRSLEAAGVDIDAQIARSFDGAEAAEVKAIVHQGRLSEADQVYLALTSSDSEEVRTLRALDRRTPSQLASIRQEYSQKYQKSLDQGVEEGLSGRDKARAQIMLEGVEPTPQGRANYISKMMVHHLNAPEDLFHQNQLNQRQLLDDLHGWSKEDLKLAAQLYEKQTGAPLEQSLRDRLAGSDEMMALAYLGDGREDAKEKLLRAINGKNDRDLIRKTLEGSDNKTRQEILNDSSLMREMKDDLTKTQWSEFTALLNDGKLDNIEKLGVALADGGDHNIMGSVRALTAKERLQVLTDPRLAEKMKDALDSDNFEAAQSILAVGKEPLDYRIARVKSSDDLYRLVGTATPGERQVLREKNWLHLQMTSGLDWDRLNYLFEHGAQNCKDKVITAENDQEVMTALRTAKKQELLDASQDPKFRSIIDDLNSDRKSEAQARLSGRQISATESVHYALEQEDSQQLLQLAKDHPDLAEQFKQTYSKDLLMELKSAMKRDDFRQAEAALRAPARDNTQLQDRVRADMHEDRDDQEVFASASNGILDVFSDAGRDMDDAARQVRANQNSNEIQSLESNFQARRQEMHVAKAKVADTLSDVAIGALASMATLGAGTGIAGLFQAGLRCGVSSLAVEKTLRGNDYSLSESGGETFAKGFVAGSAAQLGNIVKLESGAVNLKAPAQLTRTEKAILAGFGDAVEDTTSNLYENLTAPSGGQGINVGRSFFQSALSGALGGRAKYWTKENPGLFFEGLGTGVKEASSSVLDFVL